VAAAESICAGVLSTTTDELSPSTRRLLGAVVDFSATHGPRFTRRALRDVTGLGDSQLKVHLARLVDLEYVTADRAGPATSYELVAAAAVTTAASPVAEPDRPVGEGYRPGSTTHRPVETPDRPGIGRFSGQSDGGPSAQVNGGEAEDGERSATFGRLASVTETPPLCRDDDPNDADRPGLAALRGTGGDERSVVIGA
jgi:hypothetical protein